MRTALASAALLLAASALAACGSGDGTSARDPGPSGDSMPTSAPAAPGQVTTVDLATVMDQDGPELCLGAVAESWPPQCGGPPIDGWSWADHRGAFESHQGIRWGRFAVTGTWDGETFTYAATVPAALYDAMAAPPPVRATPATSYSDAELDAIAEEMRELPGAQGADAGRGQVLVDVLYDDGSLQRWAENTYGVDVVVVRSLLVDQG
jgi:hypothetical protein